MTAQRERNRSEVNSSREHFDVLDGLRGTAALMVLFGHATAVMLGADDTLVPRKGLAVMFFFMLSGFVVASAYDKKLENGMSFYDFMRRRVIRLYPLIWLGLVLGTIWFGSTASDFGVKGFVNIALGAVALPGPLTQFSFSHFPINPPQWSLFFEMIAYALYATVRLTTKRMIAFVAACTVGFLIVDHYYLLNKTPLFLNLPQFGACFFGGVLLWRAYEAGLIPNIRLSSWALSLPIVVICLCPFWLGPVVDYAALLFVFPVVIALGAVKGRGAATKFERVLGDLSYPVYILHWPFLEASRHFVQPQFGAAMATAVAVISTVMFAWVAFELFDKPVRRWLSRPAVQRIAIKESVLS